MARYPNISDHGLIGDLQTAALVTTDGCVDWFCCPRFDSPGVFASILDADHGGYFRIAPDRDDYVSKQLYFPDTAILITRFLTPDGVGELHDFMPIAGTHATDRHRLVRQIRVVRGPPRRIPPEEVQQLADETAGFWRAWVDKSTYTGRWHEMVARSVMTLKLMTYAPTGAIVAAPTAGLPEQTGGERNWDYRYTRIRDGSFSLYVLLGLGYVEEARAFGVWLGGLAGDEGTFSLCTFWYVDALARAGRLDDARLTFEKMHTYGNHLGLYSEEIGSTGEQLGNFPQAFSHLALISAAINLDHQLDHRPGRPLGAGSVT